MYSVITQRYSHVTGAEYGRASVAVVEGMAARQRGTLWS
jgi:hypothetical protein